MSETKWKECPACDGTGGIMLDGGLPPPPHYDWRHDPNDEPYNSALLDKITFSTSGSERFIDERLTMRQLIRQLAEALEECYDGGYCDRMPPETIERHDKLMVQAQRLPPSGREIATSLGAIIDKLEEITAPIINVQTGKRVDLDDQDPQHCSICNGTGEDNECDFIACKSCKGSGRV